jgi:hypothetical protein
MEKTLKLDNMDLTQEEKDDLAFAVGVAITDGPEPSESAKAIFIKYKRGEIDRESALKAISNYHKKTHEN